MIWLYINLARLLFFWKRARPFLFIEIHNYRLIEKDRIKASFLKINQTFLNQTNSYFARYFESSFVLINNIRYSIYVIILYVFVNMKWLEYILRDFLKNANCCWHLPIAVSLSLLLIGLSYILYPFFISSWCCTSHFLLIHTKDCYYIAAYSRKCFSLVMLYSYGLYRDFVNINTYRLCCERQSLSRSTTATQRLTV